MRNRIDLTWMNCAFVLLVSMALFILEVLLFQWFLGLFGCDFGFWTVVGIIFVLDIVATKFKRE